MKKKNKIFHFLVFMAVSAFVLVMLYWLLGKNVFRFSDTLKAEFKSKQEKLQETQMLLASVPNPSKTSEEIREKTAHLKEISYNKKQLPKLIQALVKTATDQGLNVLSVRPREDLAAGQRPEGITKVYLELELRCEYRAFAEYIEAISALPYSFTVESLAMTKKAGNDGSAQLEIAVMISAYMLNEF